MRSKNNEELKTAEQASEPASAAQISPEQTPVGEAKAIVTSEPEAGEPAIEGLPEKLRVTHRFGLNLRSGPGKAHSVVRVLPCGAELVGIGLAVEGDGSMWLPVEGGYVDSAYLALADAEG